MAVRLDEVLDVDHLAHLVASGLVSRRPHPRAPLVVYDYTDRASRARAWDHETRTCRGLIVDADGLVRARPFRKFFTVEEHQLDPALGPLPAEAPVEVFDKLDGSLGILYPDGDDSAVTTRGSFTSDQARWATDHFRSHYDGAAVPPGVTLLFEIIHPANRVVVDYGGFEGLVLLAAIDIDTGADRDLPAAWPGPVVGRHDGAGLADAVDLARRATGTEREGWVVRFAGAADRPSLRVKVKAADYIRLHHLLTGVSARTIWEHLAEGRSLDPITDRVPGDFAAWVHAVAAELGGAYRAVEADCRRVLADAEDTDRALAAERFRRSGANTAVLFKMLDQRPYDQIIWRAVRPTPGRVFRIDAG